MVKAVWITGATSGIGKEIALAFARKGETVIASARRAQELERISSNEDVELGCIVPIPMDISDNDSILKAIGKIKSEYSISCLVNNAGISSFKNAIENDFREIETIIDTNLTGAIQLTRSVLPDMMEKKSGRIINILSVTTKKIFTKSSVYAASKAGLEAYMNVLREELREFNIRVTNIYPGATKTPIWPNEALERYSSRMMKPDVVAKVVYDTFMQNENIVPEEIVLRPVKGDL